jgi:hypothetical protein
MEPQGSLPSLKEFATGSYFDPDFSFAYAVPNNPSNSEPLVIFRNIFFNLRDELLDQRPTNKREDHQFSAVCD